jgi:hypothetical protein
MTPRQIANAEHVVWLLGFLAIVTALAAVDWRLGLFVVGVLLIGSGIDWRRS